MEQLDSIVLRLQQDFGDFDQPIFWVQLVLLVAAASVAWMVHRWLGGRFVGAAAGQGMRRLTRRTLQRLAFPLVTLSIAWVCKAILEALDLPTAMLRLAIPLLASLAVIRALVYMLRKGFASSPALKAWEHVVSTTVWTIVALHLLGLLAPVQQGLDGLAFQMGSARVSALAVIKLLMFLALLFTVALWLARVIEQRLQRSRHMSPTMQVGIAKFAKFFLLTLAALLTLDSAGIDLTTMAVFGGALGVGLGFGLQRIASNFISGFILLFDRSLKPGDVITVGNTFGWIEELRARYLVVRTRDGVETLIPNETFVTTEVINWSFSDRKVRLHAPVQISYGDDPEQAIAIMEAAARNCSRVLPEPPPVARLMGFGDNGIELDLRMWINDPENGVANVKTDVNLGIWRGFKEAGITIPFPQRDVHLFENDPQPEQG